MLKIINDTGLNIACDIKAGERIFNHRHGDGAVSYDIDSDSKADIEIVKEDIWASNEPYSTLFFIPYTFDLVFGNMSDAENLPLTISYKGILNEDNSTVYLSKIIGINQNSLRRWSKYASIQCHFVSILVLILGVLLSFIFNGWTQLLFVLTSVILSVGIMILALHKKKALLNCMKNLMIL